MKQVSKLDYTGDRKSGGFLLFLIFQWSQLLCAEAFANPFGEKTMQGALNPRQVDRSFVMPKGWMELQLSVDSKYSVSQRGTSGEEIALAEDQYWSYSQMWLNYSNAFSHRVMMYLNVPFVHAQFQPSDGDAIATTALGDVHSGFYVQPDFGNQLLGFQVDLKSPSGVEWPSSRRGGPSDINGFLTGTGLTNLGLLAHGRMKLGNRYAAQISAGYIFKFPGIVGYVLEENGFGNGILNAGNELRVDGKHLVQVTDKICLEFLHGFSQRGEYLIGVSGEGVRWNSVDEQILEPGWFLDAGGAVSWEPNPKRQVRLAVSDQVLGAETMEFAVLGLEEFSPQPGMKIALEGSVRW